MLSIQKRCLLGVYTWCSQKLFLFLFLFNVESAKKESFGCPRMMLIKTLDNAPKIGFLANIWSSGLPRGNLCNTVSVNTNKCLVGIYTNMMATKTFIFEVLYLWRHASLVCCIFGAYLLHYIFFALHLLCIFGGMHVWCYASLVRWFFGALHLWCGDTLVAHFIFGMVILWCIASLVHL